MGRSRTTVLAVLLAATAGAAPACAEPGLRAGEGRPTAQAAPEASPRRAGQVACAPRDTALDYLARVYGEAPVAGGVANSGGLIEVLASAETGTWTIIITSPRGLSCSVAAGEGWRKLEPETPEPGT